MKKRTILALGAMLLAVLLCFSGCAKLLQGMENPEVREDTCAMLDALLADDLDAAYALVSQVSTWEEFVPVNVPGLSQAAYAEPYYLLGKLHHWEAGR